MLEVMIDGGESAKNLTPPGLQRLLTLVNGGKVNAVIIAKLDRLTRSVKDLSSFPELFEKRGVALISVGESLDTASAAGRMVITIMAAVLQWEREAIGERTRDALRHKRTSGGRVGNTRFGFRLSPDGKPIEPDPGEQGVLQNPSLAPERPHDARDPGRFEPPSTPYKPWLGLAAGARSTNHEASKPSLIPKSMAPGPALGPTAVRVLSEHPRFGAGCNYIKSNHLRGVPVPNV